MARLLLVVPAFNEEECLPATINTLNQYPYDYVIVNDGSSDHTEVIAIDYSADLISLPFNQGLSGAFSAGMRYAFFNNYDYVLQFDADGQHLPEYIEPMLHEIERTNTDILIGSRFIDAKMPLSMRSFGSLIIRFMLKITTGQALTDPTSGMRVYNRRMIELYAKRPDLSPEPDTLAYLMRNGAKVVEYPVVINERIAGVSYLRSWSAVKYMARMAFSILMIQFVRARVDIKEEVTI